MFVDGLEANKDHDIVIEGVVNPRSFKETEKWLMSSMDTDGVSAIDVGYKIGVTMTIPGDMNGFFAQTEQTMNGEIADYKISF